MTSETKGAMPDGFAPEQTHVVHQWKFSSPLINCRFEPNGRYVVSCAEDNTIQRWEYPTGKVTVLEGHDSWPRGIAFSPDGDTLLTTGCDEKLIYWPINDDSPKPIRSVKAHKGWVRCLDVSPSGAVVATGGNDNLVKLWDREGVLIAELAGHESHVYSVRFHPDGKTLLSGDLKGKVVQWDIEDGKQLRTFDAKDLHSYNKGQKVDYGGVRSLSISPDGKYLACGGLHKATNPLGAINEPLVVVFNWEDQTVVRSHQSEGVRGVIWRSFYLDDGSILAASGGGGGGYLLFWKAEEQTIHKFKLKDTVRGMDIHADTLHVATAHWDRHLRISRIAAKTETDG